MDKSKKKKEIDLEGLVSATYNYRKKHNKCFAQSFKDEKAYCSVCPMDRKLKCPFLDKSYICTELRKNDDRGLYIERLYGCKYKEGKK